LNNQREANHVIEEAFDFGRRGTPGTVVPRSSTADRARERPQHRKGVVGCPRHGQPGGSRRTRHRHRQDVGPAEFPGCRGTTCAGFFGASPDRSAVTGKSRKFAERSGLKIENRKILLSVCRLVERKGIHWFVDNVISYLLDDYKDFIYIIVGDGPLQRDIINIIQKKKLSERVVLLGRIDDELLKFTYNISDVLIMPNISVEGDMEGLGIVALEASSCNLPVVGSDLEGIIDVLLEGEMGILVPSLDAKEFKRKVLHLLSNDNFRCDIGKKARNLALKNFLWPTITKKYLQIFKDTH